MKLKLEIDLDDIETWADETVTNAIKNVIFTETISAVRKEIKAEVAKMDRKVLHEAARKTIDTVVAKLLKENK